jgi:hypothetical protein
MFVGGSGMLRKRTIGNLLRAWFGIGERMRIVHDAGMHSRAYPDLSVNSKRCFVDTLEPSHQFTDDLRSDYPARFIDFVIEEDDQNFAPLRERVIVAGGKARSILTPTVRDKIKGLHAYNETSAWIRRYIPGGVYQGVPGRRNAVRRYRRAYLTPGPLYTFKCDIADFFGSVDHDMLRAQFRRFGPPELLPTLEGFLSSKVIDGEGRLRRLDRGIPLGNPLSHALAQLILLTVDRHMARVCGSSLSYQRYADDILLFGTNEEAVRSAAEEILGSLSALRLRENKEKTVFLSRSDEHVYLGYRFRDGVIDIPPRNILRAKRRIRNWTRTSRFKKQRRNNHGKAIVKSIAEVVNHRIWLWVSFFDLVTDTSAFRDLDRFMGRRIAIAMAGKRGRRLSQDEYSLLRQFGPVGHYRTYIRMTHGSGN